MTDVPYFLIDYNIKLIFNVARYYWHDSTIHFLYIRALNLFKVVAFVISLGRVFHKYYDWYYM